jgi:hypothetical protein
VAAGLLLALALALGVTVASGPTAARAAPHRPPFGPAIDAYAMYQPQRTCDPTAKPGVIDFRNLLDQTYGVHASGIGRPCGGGVSEHYDGRALDYMLNAYNAGDLAVANDLLGWLLSMDQYGNSNAMARRFGIMYIIWNRHIWGAWDPPGGWRTYQCDGTPGGCHTNHIHVSFGWPGALRQTTWWAAR